MKNKKELTIEEMNLLEGYLYGLDINDPKFSNLERVYILRAKSLPYEVMCAYLEEYDSSNRKIDELAFVDNIAKKHNLSHKEVLTRAREVRALTRYKNQMKKLKLK